MRAAAGFLYRCPIVALLKGRLNIPTPQQSEFRTRGSAAAPPEASAAGTGWLILLWYAGLVIAALLMRWAMGAASVAVAAGLAAAAAVIPLALLGYTMRSYGDTFNPQILVPAIGPIVIAVLIFEYVEYNQQVDDAYSAQLIPTELVLLSDVKWAGAPGRAGQIRGHVVNRSPHQLVGISVEVMLYGSSEKLAGATAEAKLDLAPGGQSSFNASAPESSPGGGEVPCLQQDALPPPARGGKPGGVECFFRVTRTRGEQVFF